MSLWIDMQGPLTEIARVRAICIVSIGMAAEASRLTGAIDCLQDVADRARALGLCPAGLLTGLDQVRGVRDELRGSGLGTSTEAMRLGRALDLLERAATEVRAHEDGPVPRHWRQRPATFAELRAGDVVSLTEARRLRAMAGARA